ncbi:MAG: LysE family transporter [Actinomycetota bacterium]
MTLGVLLLGFALGFLFVIPPGPLAVTLVEVGVTQGRGAGARSGAGIAAGDLAVGSAAGVVVVFGGALPDGAFAAVQIVSAAVLIALGVAMILRPTAVEAVAGAIHRPGRAFFALTVLTPTVFGAWVAIIAALPFTDDLSAIGTFVVGVGLASALYHVALGSAAGAFGRHLHGAAMNRIAQAGGGLFVVLGAVMALG